MGHHRRRQERDAVSGVLETVQVDQRALYSRAGSFSGGNQQKIALAKWLLSGSNTLLLYDPTRASTCTKHEIYVLIRNFVRGAWSVLLFSTEIPELVNLCDRVVVMYAGMRAKTIDAEDLSEDSIIHATLGGSMQTETAKT